MKKIRVPICELTYELTDGCREGAVKGKYSKCGLHPTILPHLKCGV